MCLIDWLIGLKETIAVEGVCAAMSIPRFKALATSDSALWDSSIPLSEHTEHLLG